MSGPNADATGIQVLAGASGGEDSGLFHGGAKPRLSPDAVERGSMIWIPGGAFIMGSNKFYREERPARAEAVDGFWIDPHPVTNAEFRRFVLATGYVTLAERAPDPATYPDADPSLLAPGSLVFTKPDGPVDLRDYRAWWAYVLGANWRRPEGPESNIDDRWDHPVVHVAFADVVAYAAWAGKTIPTEAEWEFAARGGLQDATYAWGEEFSPDGRAMANTWQGRFPWENLAEDGYEGTSPVGAFPANGYGIYDMIGNVWEWTASAYALPRAAAEKQSCCQPKENIDGAANRVVKGGSHLCAPNYCLRYRPSARQSQPLDTSTTHIGFRCVVRS
jgi:formylglycine-generating enzyme required for sulfatase activity